MSRSLCSLAIKKREREKKKRGGRAARGKVNVEHVCKGTAISPVGGSTERVGSSITGRAVVSAGGGKRNCDATHGEHGREDWSSIQTDGGQST